MKGEDVGSNTSTTHQKAEASSLLGGPAGALCIPWAPQAAEPVELARVFQYLDEDGDGNISPAELRNCMRAIGEELPLEDAETLVESADSDGDGLLGLEDFMRLVDGEGEGEEEKARYVREAFRAYEMEGEGCITPKSLERALARLGEYKSVEECEIMIHRFDINGDGVISFDEFEIMML